MACTSIFTIRIHTVNCSKWDGVVIKLNGKKGGKVQVYVTGQIKFRLKYNLVNVAWIVSFLCLLALITDELGLRDKGNWKLKV